MSESESPVWSEFFGFESPYANQADAIEAAIDAGEQDGYLALEGPCGTGKTMAALTAAAHLIRHDRYENVLVVTPVKQQLRQFVTDLRTMNGGLDEPLDGVALVGKRDLCPYGREDVFPRDASVHDRCEDLRENTANLVEGGEDSNRYDGEDVDELVKLRPTDALDDPWWDPVAGRDLARAARADGMNNIDASALTTAGADSPYVRNQPSAPDDFVGDGQDTPLYCPFEADWYGRNKGSPVGFDDAEHNVVEADDLLPLSVEHGTCPHRAQQVMLEHADVVIGNYNHLFDPRTRPLVEAIIDERTFVIVDEAHRIEERVRDLLSDRIGHHTLVRARNDLQELLQHARQADADGETVEEALSSYDVTPDDVEATREFVHRVTEWMEARVEDYLIDEFGTTAPDALAEERQEIPLRDPETAEPDALTEYMEAQGYSGSEWRMLANAGTAAEAVLDEITERQTVCGAVGELLTRWYEHDNATFFREIELEYSPKELGSTSAPWQTVYTPAFVAFNCMPADEVRNVLDGVGGGVLMSATLEPIDVFSSVTGLDALEAAGRPILKRSYNLPFPADNRASFTVDAAPFTAHNRGNPSEDPSNRTRDEYKFILRTVARSPGNVLVCMPNYREAQWAGNYLQSAVEKPVLVDESSSDESTEDLKRSFFRGGGKVVVTSTRGTLTEGVDYDGDKLHACAVVGIPLVNVGSPRIRAVRKAYADAFGDDVAFEYALTVPAIRRARQAIGRVVRGHDECGVRILAGNRYVEGARHSVFQYLSPGEREEFVRMTPEFLDAQLDRFWDSVDAPPE